MRHGRVDGLCFSVASVLNRISQISSAASAKQQSLGLEPLGKAGLGPNPGGHAHQAKEHEPIAESAIQQSLGWSKAEP